jgi:hypothetical protein
MVTSVLSRQLDDLELTLARHGYPQKGLGKITTLD